MPQANNDKINWKDVISDPKDREVFQGLANPVWGFRTVAGLAKEAKLSEDEVKSILDKYPASKKVRYSGC